MITRIYAEFETPDDAEFALGRVRELVPEIFSANIMYNRKSEQAAKLRGGKIYTIIPTAVTTHNYLTASMESPASEDVIPEHLRKRTAVAYVICDSEYSEKVRNILSSTGGLNIRTPDFQS